MAEFKLGRIRFVWKSTWTTSTTYYKDDVVKVGGKVYICVAGHSAAADFYTDLNAAPSKWNQLSDGQAWTGPWATTTAYKVNDLVKYGGIVYSCITPHTSAATSALGLEADQAKWDQFAEGFDWLGDWTAATRYKVNDLIKYGGITYVCNTSHTSAATTALGLEPDQSKWDEFNQGIEFHGTWASTHRYKLNDVVKYGGNLWICDTPHTSTSSFATDQGNWTIFVEGFQFEDTWSSSTTYQPGDVVRYGGNQYVSKTTHSSSIPTTPDSTDWDLFLRGMSFVADWSSATAYKVGEVVRLNGYTYLCIEDHSNEEPPSLTYWERLNSGTKWLGEWTNSTDYKLGDVVRFEANVYICVQGHTSNDDDSTSLADSSRSPAGDTEGVYWNIFNIGNEYSVMSQVGDLVYYGGAIGPTRLPVGAEGQVLRTSADALPEWVYLGVVDFNYYVGNHGTDAPLPTFGRTQDKPWKSIRYACEQIEKGPRNPNTRRLLEMNRAFIQREVTEWIDYQISTATVGSIWYNFDYDEHKCERDTGYLVDRLIWDLTHGGNLKMRAAAQAYVNALGEGPHSTEEEDLPYTKLSAEADNDVAAFNYMLGLVEDILNNQAPSVNYQVLNGDNSTSVVSQFIDPDLEAETGVMPIITTLVGIVQTALTDGDTTNLPDRYVPSNLVNVLTGVYNETLPIIVPAETCILGSEVRSVTVGPTNSIIDASDAKYSISALGRLETIVGQIVTGANVTETAGNTVSQDVAVPFADVEEVTSVTRLVRAMQQKIDFNLGTLALASYTDPTDYNTSYLIGYGDARKLIKENKKFFQVEVRAFLDANYPTLKYSRTACLRDVGYIVDAIVYDLTYGGNAMSVQAGLAYYQGVGSSLYIDSSEKTATIAAYNRLKSLMQDVAVDTPTTNLQIAIPQYRDTGGSAGAATLIGNNLTEMIDIVNNGVAAATLTDPSTTWAAGGLTSAYSTLNSAAATIAANTITYIDTNYPTLVYDETKCSRDVEIILKAVGYDFMFNSNFQTIKAAYSYLRATASEVFSLGQKNATRAALEYVRTQAIANVGADATAIARINSSMKIIDDIIFAGSNEGSICQTDQRNADWARLQLERNRDYIVAEIGAWIDATFVSTASDTTDTTNVITVDSTSWMQRNTAVRFAGGIPGAAGIVAGTTYYVQKIISSTQFTVAATRWATDADQIPLTTSSGAWTVNMYYSKTLCLRDVNRYIDALKFDLMYPGNYETLLAARYYSNAVTGSLEENMFLVRNGTGVRNMTLTGLTGDLTPENVYGTSRVTAGAYVSLDPGWGPDDFRTWVTSRSCYVQNCTTFGYGAIGQKIDGSLHAGGNKSMVSNDFTQLISDGIGAWVSNNGRAELVSVFTYYSHIGYLAESGGRIRGTNGNNSYGDFGSVAEGFDATETAGTATVDNKFQFKATVGSVTTDLVNVLNFEFDNAGTEYTEATWLVVGPGNFAEVEQDEFRDDGVFNVRLLDLVDDSTTAPEADGNIGGTGYILATGTAQSGTLTAITLSATDGALSTAYVGVKIVITSGSGIGQFAIINSYDSGTKIANVVTESSGASGWDHFVAGTAIQAPDSSSSYSIEPAISFSAPSYSATASTLPTSGTWSAVQYCNTSAVYTSLAGTYSGTGASGATWTVQRNGSKYWVTQLTAGIGYTRLQTITIAGTSLGGTSTTNDLVITITSVNSVSGAIQAWDTEGYGAGGRFVALRSGSVVGATSEDGISWTTRTSMMPTAAAWSDVAGGVFDDGSSNEKVSRFVAVAGGSANTDGAWSADGITWNAVSMRTSATWVGVAYGESRFVAIASDSTTVRISQDGEVWDLTGTLPSTGFTSVTYGKGLFVAVKSGTNAAASSTDGVTWAARTLPSSSNWNSVSYGNNRFVAVSNTSGTVAAYSLNGTTWTASTLSATASWTKVTYGQGMFLAVSASTQAASSPDGIVWTSRTMSTAANGFSDVAFGNPNRTGKFVAVGGSTGTVASYVYCGATAKARAFVASTKIAAIRITEPGSGYASAPTLTIVDPTNIYEAPTSVRFGKGVLANPSFKNRGTGYITASAELDQGDGYAETFQDGSYVACRNITVRPVPGSNLVFDSLPGTYKVVSVVTFRGNFPGAYSAFYQVSPVITTSQAPVHGTSVTTRIRYSQVRLTGHDFLDIGSGSFEDSNYPGTPDNAPNQANETLDSNGGRVFFTSTDQDGNFRVGDLFTIEQSTGVATLNADAFNISGLQELSLGDLTLGGGSATITEFSTDSFFTADSDTVIPTQRAIKAYIASQIGGGGASLIVNSVTAGDILIGTNVITNITGGPIIMNATIEFRGGFTGVPLAFDYFLN